MATDLVEKDTWKDNRKHRAFIEYWTNPQSETFGNVYQSGLKAGFSKTYSMNIVHLAPKWLSKSIERLNLEPEHIKQGIQELATKTTDPLDSRSPADTRLKAYEILAKITGMIDNKSNTTNVIVQPILGGLSQNPAQAKTKIKSTIVEQEELDQELID